MVRGKSDMFEVTFVLLNKNALHSRLFFLPKYNVSVKFPIRIVGMCAVLKVSKNGVTFNCHQIIMATLIVILPQKSSGHPNSDACAIYILFVPGTNDWPSDS